MNLQRAGVGGVESRKGGSRVVETAGRGVPIQSLFHPHPEPVPIVCVGDADFFAVLGRDSRTAGGG